MSEPASTLALLNRLFDEHVLAMGCDAPEDCPSGWQELHREPEMLNVAAADEENNTSSEGAQKAAALLAAAAPILDQLGELAAARRTTRLVGFHYSLH